MSFQMRERILPVLTFSAGRRKFLLRQGNIAMSWRRGDGAGKINFHCLLQ